MLVAGHAHARDNLIGGVRKVGAGDGGDLSQRFLMDCNCFESELEQSLVEDLGNSKPCVDLHTYETSPLVVYKSITLHNDNDRLKNIPLPLTSYKDEMVRDIIDSIEKFFPEMIVRGSEQLDSNSNPDPNPNPKPKPESDPKPMSLAALDHRYWSKPFDEAQFEKAVKFLSDLNYVSKKVYVNPFKQLRQKILDEKKDLLCESEIVQPVQFWKRCLDEFPDINNDLKDIILRGNNNIVLR